MNRDEIHTRLERVMQRVFDIPIRITDDMTANDVDGWDSLTYVQLLFAVETEFRIKFTTPEVIDLKTVGGMMDLVAKKLG